MLRPMCALVLAATLPPAHGVDYSWEDFSSSDCSGTPRSTGTLPLPGSEVSSSNACISHSTISFHNAWCDVSVAPPLYKRVKYPEQTGCAGRSFNEEIRADGTCHGWPSGSSTKFYCGANVCLEGLAPASDGRGCPGQVGGCSGGCCLDENQPDSWCDQNYASDSRCVNNACGSDDCCVPNSSSGAIVAVIVGAILAIFVVSCACFMTSMHRKNQRANAMHAADRRAASSFSNNEGTQFAEGVPVQPASVSVQTGMPVTQGTVVAQIPANSIPVVQAVAVPV